MKQTDSEIKALQSMLKTVETMFFSMPIPEEVVAKYNFLKESKFRQANLDFIPITKSQFPLIGTKSISTPTSEKQFINNFQDPSLILCENISNFSLGILENWLNAITQFSEEITEIRMKDLTELKLKLSKNIKDFQISNNTRIQDNLSNFLIKTDQFQIKFMESLEKLHQNNLKLQTEKKSLKSENSMLLSNIKLKEKQLFESHAEEIYEIQRDLTSLKSRNEVLEGTLKQINIKLKSFYDKYGKNETLGIESELSLTDFIISYSIKLNNDNQWLVDNLAKFAKENEDLKKGPKLNENLKSDLLNEAKIAKNLLENFQKSHSDLLVFLCSFLTNKNRMN